MLTADQIKSMSETEAHQELDRLAVAYFGTTRWKTDFAELAGVERQGVNAWFTDDRRPPVWAFLVLEAWTANRDIAIHLRNVKAALDYAATLPESD